MSKKFLLFSLKSTGKVFYNSTLILFYTTHAHEPVLYSSNLVANGGGRMMDKHCSITPPENLRDTSFETGTGANAFAWNLVEVPRHRKLSLESSR